MTSFYEAMIKKARDPAHIAQFTQTLDIIRGYAETSENEEQLIWLYEKIQKAKKQTKKRKLDDTTANMAQTHQKIQAMYDDDSDAQADVMLAEALFDMWL